MIIRGGKMMYTAIVKELNDNIEEEAIISINNIDFTTFIAFTPYKNEQNNKWLKCEKIISQINAEIITLEYNTYLRKMRNPSPHERRIKLTPINL